MPTETSQPDEIPKMVISQAVKWIDNVLSEYRDGIGLNEISTGRSASWWQANPAALNELISIYENLGWKISTDITSRRTVIILSCD